MPIIGTILSAIGGSLFGGSGAASAVTNVGKWAALAAIAIPAWQWYQGHQNDVAVSFSYSQVLFVGLILFAVLQVAHVAKKD
jgi:hypothetical protein